MGWLATRMAFQEPLGAPKSHRRSQTGQHFGKLGAIDMMGTYLKRSTQVYGSLTKKMMAPKRGSNA